MATIFFNAGKQVFRISGFSIIPHCFSSTPLKDILKTAIEIVLKDKILKVDLTAEINHDTRMLTIKSLSLSYRKLQIGCYFKGKKHGGDMNHLFRNLPFSLILPFVCLIFMDGAMAIAMSFRFIDTGQRLGKIIQTASIACGDMNNDGYVDLVLASQERGTIIQLYLNDGEGNFTRTDDLFPVTENPNPLWNFGIVLRDFNRDGLLDIATADAWRGVNVYLNRKDNGFQWFQAILVPEVNEVKGIDAADIDHDGDDDLVFGGHNGIPDRADRIYLNDGSGHFIDSGQRIGFDVTWDTIFGDIDNDGNTDYISINRYREHTAKIHLNNGKGIFNWTFDIPTTQTDDSYDVKLADLNTDGLLDIVIANSVDTQNATTSKVFINKGNLVFELTDGLIGEPNCETKGIEVIDIDNDGYPDIILGNHNWANTIYRNDGTGKFTKMDVEILANPANAIPACDLNNDGFIDLIIGYGSDTSDGHYRIFLNDGKGLTKNLPPDPPTMLKSEVKGKNVYLSWKPGFDHSGAPLQFTESRESIGCLNGTRIIAADVNADGKLDIIVGNGEELRQQSEIYLNDGKGHFTFSGQGFDKYFLRDMAVGDIDGDGNVDWIVGTQGDGVKVLKNDGNGLFQIWQNIGSEYVYVRAVDLGDADGDGDLDLLYGSVGNRIYLNDGKGNFLDSGQDLGDHYLTQVVKFADLNGDGNLDFVQGNRIFENYDPADRVFFNSGNGVFIDSGQRLGQWSTFDMDLGDVDGDGALDLVAVCPLNGANKLYLNDGNGFFTDSGQSLNPSSESNEGHAVRFGDLDHDGDLDIVIGDWNLGLKIFLNDGHGHFTKSDISLGTGKTGHIVLVDIDQDGDIDIIESKEGGDCNKIYLNNQAKNPQIGLTYNIQIGTYPGGNNIVSGLSSYSPGHLGNALSYRIQGLKEGTYYWSVQTVNSGFKKSEWSQEKQFIVEPDIHIQPSSWNYGDILIGSRVEKDFAVQNIGPAILNVSGASLVGPDASQFVIIRGGEAFSLQPGNYQTVTVRFAPTSPGSKAVTLRFTSNDPDDNLKDIPLSGRGVSPIIDLIVSSISGPNTGKPGSKISISNTVMNQGTQLANGPFLVNFYLSTDTQITTGDILLGKRSIKSLAAGVSDGPASTQVTIPKSVAPGSYFIGAIVDPSNKVLESNEGNNTNFYPNAITICLSLSKPSLISPKNRAINISATPGLDWSDVNGASHYEVQVGTDSAFSTILRSNSNVIDSQWIVDPPLPAPLGIPPGSQTVFWRVRAGNDCSAGPWSSTRRFKY